MGTSWVTLSLVMSKRFATFAAVRSTPTDRGYGQTTLINIQSYLYYG